MHAMSLFVGLTAKYVELPRSDMTAYTCVLSNRGKEVSIHTFDLPTDNTVSYTIRSIHAFRTRECKKLSAAITASIASENTIIQPEWHTHVNAGNDCDPYLHMFRDWPRTHHATLWDLYTAIGYDYKKRRYVK